MMEHYLLYVVLLKEIASSVVVSCWSIACYVEVIIVGHYLLVGGFMMEHCLLG
jgi:hypothetical protein